MNRKVISVILVLCLLVSSIAVGSFAVTAANGDDDSTLAAAGSQAPQDKVQGAAILHCFNWSYNNIKSNLSAIKAAGYTAVQTSPVQPPKDYNSGWTNTDGQWWKLYQPIDISIANGNTWLGTKSELQSLCTEADRYGIKVIVDIVANHMADNGLDRNGMDNVNSQVNSTLRNNSSYWHLENIKADGKDRYNTTHGSIGNPDLNTGNSYIQNRFKSLLTECINLGVDGFRFDAAKHIELPTDSRGASNFWPVVINGSKGNRTDLYYYGEILHYPVTDIENYTEYMSVTDHYSGEQVMFAADNNDVSRMADTHYYKDAAADKAVLWCESHDTYIGNKPTKNVNNTSFVKGWAIVASRADASALFFARPNSNMGAASSDTTWKSKAVAEVNKFKNFFDGTGESVSAENKCCYNERGTTGVVISRPEGGGSVTLTAKKMEDGTYKDQVSGGTFTVSNGKITGTVGSTGVAVVYNTSQNPIKPTEPPTTVAPTTTTPPKMILLGDVTGDGIISVADATEIQRHASEMINLTGYKVTAADVSRDRTVTVLDATAVQRYAGEFTWGTESCGTYVSG